MLPTNLAPVSAPARTYVFGRSVAQESAGEIKRIRVHGPLLEVGDVVLKTPTYATHEYRILNIIKVSSPKITVQCVDECQPNAPLTIHTFGSSNTLETVIRGPKMDAVRKDRSRVQWCNPNYVWIEEKKEAATT